MDAALIFTWTASIPGREGLALSHAAENVEFFEKRATEGKSLPMEWFFGPGRPFFAMVKGDYDYLTELIGSEDFLRLWSKGEFLLADLHYNLYRTGGRADALFAAYGAAGSELGVL
jgi:hypothetical protein